jgi:hypothetical protein
LQSDHANPQAAALRYVFAVEDPTRLLTRGRFDGPPRRAAEAVRGLSRYVDYQTDPLADSPHRVALFECMIDPVTGKYLSEDFAFCRRWTDLDGQIWIDTDSKLTHFGSGPLSSAISARISTRRLQPEVCRRPWRPSVWEPADPADQVAAAA